MPVVPNFTQGSASSTTRTTTNISETIRTIEFSGSTYSVSGAGVTTDGDAINPKYTDLQQTLNGETYTWQQVDLNSRPNY